MEILLTDIWMECIKRGQFLNSMVNLGTLPYLALQLWSSRIKPCPLS